MAFTKVWTDGDCRGCDKCITSIKVCPCEWCEYEDSSKCDTCEKDELCNFEFKKPEANK